MRRQTGFTSPHLGRGGPDKDGHNFYVSAEYKNRMKSSLWTGRRFTQHDYTSSGGIDYDYGAKNI